MSRTRASDPGLVGVLVADLAAEHQDLASLIADLDPALWDRETPAASWTIRDQVDHLAFGDRAAVRALSDPDGYRRDYARRQADPAGFAIERARVVRSPPNVLVASWAEASDLLLTVLRLGEREPGRVPWAGSTMSVPSLVTARLMEAWAHGQDIADTCGVDRPAADRLRHVARLGVATRRYSFRSRGLSEPHREPFVRLTLPSGSLWTSGDNQSSDRVLGPALDFCHVVTRRRHWTSTALVVDGDGARAWLEIAQAYAGDPGPGRRPASGRISR